MKKMFSIMPHLSTQCRFKLDLLDVDQQVVNPRHQTSQGQSVAKPVIPLYRISV